MVVVAENSAADLLDILGKAGAFPIVETRWADAPAAIAEIQPVALAVADPHAARSLNARDVDGVVVGDGLGPRVVEALLTVLAENPRFRDLPVGVLNNTAVDEERLPNLVRVGGDPRRLVEHVLPFVRLQAFE